MTGSTPAAARAAAASNRSLVASRAPLARREPPRATNPATAAWACVSCSAGQAAVADFVAKGGSRRANGALLATGDLFDAAAALAAAGVEPVTVSRPDYVFESRSAVLDRFTVALGR